MLWTITIFDYGWRCEITINRHLNELLQIFNIFVISYKLIIYIMPSINPKVQLKYLWFQMYISAKLNE